MSTIEPLLAWATATFGFSGVLSLYLRPGDYTRKRSLDQLTALVHAEQRREAWVFEGVYGELIEPPLPRAQLLVWLDLPWMICLARRNARQADRGLAADSESFGALISYAAAYWQRDDMRSHAGHSRLFEEFSGDKHRLSTEDDVNAFLTTHAL